MKKLADRGRKILSMIIRGISVSAASLILQACYGMLLPDDPGAEYGMPPPGYDETTIYGKVVSLKETEKPIPGIKVSIEGTKYWDYTNKDGRFTFQVPIQDVYRIKLEDVDGPAQGGQFKEQTWTLSQNDTYYNLLIGMDLDS